MFFNHSSLYFFVICLLLQGCANQLQPKSDYAPPPGAMPVENSNQDTGYLEPTAGHKGDGIGAEVISSEVIGDEQEIEIMVPINPDLVDQIQVTSSTGDSVVLTREAQIVQNYENNSVGISIRIPKTDNLGFRLKLIDHPDDDWPPRRYQ